jgi:hypothetical protein
MGFPLVLTHKAARSGKWVSENYCSETVWKFLRAHRLSPLGYENWRKEGPFCLLCS